MLASHVLWRLMLFYTHLLLLLQPSVLCFSIFSFNNDAKIQPKWILLEFPVSRFGPRLGGLPRLERLHGKIWTPLRGLPGLVDRVSALAGHPTYHVNVIKLKWEIIWTGSLPHLSGLPHLPGVLHLHVNRRLEAKLKELVWSNSKGVFHNMQKAVLSGTLNIARTNKVATWTMKIAFIFINSLPLTSFGL